MKKLLATSILLSLLALNAAAVDLKSPNGLINATLSDDGHSLTVYYKNKGKKTKAFEMPALGLSINDLKLSDIKYKAIGKPKKIKDDYTMLTGKKSRCRNKANEYTVDYSTPVGVQQMQVRVYDDGIALRYVADSLADARITDDFTTYRIAEGSPRWIQKYNPVYEDFFPMSNTGNAESREWGYPATFEATQGLFALISEAGIERNHSASWLNNSANATDYKVTLGDNALTYNGKYTSPWRLAIIGSKDALIESTLVTDVSAPSRVDDTSWIHPGSVSWIYWAYNHGSSDYQIVKKYIDMAAELNLPYVLIDAEWDEMKNGGTIEDAIAYAHQKGVKPLIWYNSSTAWVNGAPTPYYRLNKPEDREKEFAWLEQQGVAGVKIDFFDGDNQPTMEYCIDLLESAAKHNLLVNFHGATIPRGWQRTYPHLMTVEAVYGAEWYNNKPTLTNKAAAHNATLPFTRNVIGPMDYTPTTFSDSQHKHITTDAHELALPVLFESALQHWADRPESYLQQPQEVRDFISTLPTTWDETKFITGYPGKNVVLARRKGDTWWIAGINGTDKAMSINLDLSALGLKNKCQATIYEDGKGWKITKRKGIPASFDLMPRGGFIVVAKK